MFDFLGSGKEQDEKRELEDNIAQIREKVQQEEQREQQARRQDAQASDDQQEDRSRADTDDARQSGRNTPDASVRDEMQRTQQSRQESESDVQDDSQQSRTAEQGERRQRRNPQRQQARGQRQSQTQEEGGGERRAITDRLQKQDREQSGRGAERSDQQNGTEGRSTQFPSRDDTASASRASSEAQSAGQRGQSRTDRRSRPELQESIARSDQEVEMTDTDTVSEDEADENTGSQHSRISSRAGEATGARLTEEEIPNPPEMKELDIPDIQKGPLFITMNKFKDALTTLSEMKDLADELETQTGTLENTLEEDRAAEQEFRRLLDATVQGAETIQDIVSPDANN